MAVRWGGRGPGHSSRWPLAAGTPTPGPTPLAISDFANGVYEIGGSAVAVGDIWDGAVLSDWDPETDITAGVGQTSGSAELKTGVIDPQDAAFTVVFDWDLAADSYVDVSRVDWATFDLQKFRALGSTATLEITDGTTSDSEPVAAGRHRTAATYSSGLMAASTDGGSPLSIVPAGGPYTTLLVGPGIGSSVAKITFYPPQDNADLPALSSLGDGPDPDPEAVLADIRDRMAAAYAETETINYIVSGDSTRDNTYNQMIAYYTHQLAKANITLTDNASSGQSGQDWGANIDSPNLSEAIAATPGTGAGTILEYSFGINDYKNGATEAQVKGWLKTGIQDYLAAKPDAAVVLAVPVATAAAERNGVLANIYAELAAELRLPLIDTYTIMASVHGDPDYYNDGTHPNKNGSIRIVNYLLSELAPPSLYSVIDLDATFLSGGTPSPDELATTVESGYWSTSAGTPVANDDWRRMQVIAVEPNFVLRIQHQGNRTDVVFYDEDDVFLETLNTTAVSGEDYREVTIPAGAFYVRINISNDGAAYDLLGDVPSVKFAVSDVPALTMAEINTGLSINLVDNSV